MSCTGDCNFQYFPTYEFVVDKRDKNKQIGMRKIENKSQCCSCGKILYQTQDNEVIWFPLEP